MEVITQGKITEIAILLQTSDFSNLIAWLLQGAGQPAAKDVCTVLEWIAV